MKHILALYVMISCCVFTSCKKDKAPDKVPDEPCTAGKGGNLVILAKTVHHTRAIKGCKVYIKYCTNNFPGELTSVYSDSIKIPDDTVESVFTGLHPGKYFLYGTGIDSLLDNSVWHVKGGVPVNTSQDSDTLRVTVYVTEGD